MLKNYKIKVNNEAESKEAQELFFELGYEWNGSGKEVIKRRIGLIFTKEFHGKDIICYSCKGDEDIWSDYEGKELTLPQLRDLVVLHRNDVKDATHHAERGGEYFVTTDGDIYFWLGKWVKSMRGNTESLKIIETIPPIKEQGLISGADALRALADGEEVQCTITGKNEWTKDIYSIQPYYFVGGGVGQFQFRIKPRTVKIELEIPAPFEPKDGDIYYFINSSNLKGYGFNKFANDGDDECLTFYGAWRTEEEIKQVVAVLRGAICKK